MSITGFDFGCDAYVMDSGMLADEAIDLLEKAHSQGCDAETAFNYVRDHIPLNDMLWYDRQQIQDRFVELYGEE